MPSVAVLVLSLLSLNLWDSLSRSIVAQKGLTVSKRRILVSKNILNITVLIVFFSVLRSSTSLSLCRLETCSEISLALGAYLGAYPIFCDYCRFYYLSDFFWVISLISEQ